MRETPPRVFSLASCYENSITTILRLTLLQQQSVPNSQGFRNSIRAALKTAMEEAKAYGYSSEINQLAFFAAVSLLDESVLKLQSPAFSDWAQRPLQEEMFGHNRAGEVFFDNLRTLLARQDSHETADCLEVYCLCMLLGFKGKYALSAGNTDFFMSQVAGGNQSASRPSGEVQTLIRQTRDKINRIRGQVTFMPDSASPEVKQTAAIDRWSRGLGIAAICMLLVALLAYGGSLMALLSGASQLS